MSETYFTKVQLAEYERDGFVVVRGMYRDGAKLQTWVSELAAGPEEAGGAWFYYEDSLTEPGKRVLSRIEHFKEHHQRLAGLVDGDEMMGRLKELLNEPGVLFKEKVNFKMPGSDGFKLHQDSQAGWEDFTGFYISVLVTVDENTEANGCLELAAGLHMQGLIGQKWKPLTKADLKGVPVKKYPTLPGDVVFFDSYVPHGSAVNQTDQPRRNLYLTYNRASEGDFRAAYYEAKRKNFPPDIEREPGKVYEFKV